MERPLRQPNCESYVELQNLMSLARRQYPVLRRNFKHRARPIAPISLRIRSCTKDHRRVVSSPQDPSFSELVHEAPTTAGLSDSGTEEGASTDTSTQNESSSEDHHTSVNLQNSDLQNEDAVSPPGRSAGSSSSMCTPSMQEDSLPLPLRGDDGSPGTTFDPANGEELALGPWSRLPHRYKLVLSTSLAFVICNMDKVNLSVAIIPMSNQLHWNASTAGLVQSSFFWGYTLSQLPGGWLSKLFTGEVVLAAGVFVWSVATAAVPLAAYFIPSLLLSRLFVGLGEGVSPSAATDLVARNIPATERSRAVAFIFNGLNVGSVTGLVLAPAIIERFGWESVFYMFGVLGIFWSVGFKLSTEGSNPWKTWTQGKNDVSKYEHQGLNSLEKSRKQLGSSTTAKEHESIPWRAFFRSASVWAMIYTHFCGNWGHYCILAWLPTYFSEELNLSLTNAALVSVVPPLGGMFISGFAAPMADHLISKGVDATFVRKLCQTIAFVLPTAGMTLCSLDLGLSPLVTVSIISSTLAFSSFALGGLYCTHQDISPKYASILLGITNTAGAIPGILGVYLTGVLLDRTHSWTMALFVPCIFFWVTGVLVWDLFASSEPQSFEG